MTSGVGPTTNARVKIQFKENVQNVKTSQK